MPQKERFHSQNVNKKTTKIGFRGGQGDVWPEAAISECWVLFLRLV